MDKRGKVAEARFADPLPLPGSFVFGFIQLGELRPF